VLNAITQAGMPHHRMVLKDGAPVVSSGTSTSDAG
jgi:hypothetical protein